MNIIHPSRLNLPERSNVTFHCTQCTALARPDTVTGRPFDRTIGLGHRLHENAWNHSWEDFLPNPKSASFGNDIRRVKKRSMTNLRLQEAEHTLLRARQLTLQFEDRPSMLKRSIPRFHELPSRTRLLYCSTVDTGGTTRVASVVVQTLLLMCLLEMEFHIRGKACRI